MVVLRDRDFVPDPFTLLKEYDFISNRLNLLASGKFRGPFGQTLTEVYRWRIDSRLRHSQGRGWTD